MAGRLRVEAYVFQVLCEWMPTLVLVQPARALRAIFGLVLIISMVAPVANANSSAPELWRQGGVYGWADWSLKGLHLENGRLRLDHSAPREVRAGTPVLLGSAVGPERNISFDELIPSWNARTPAGSWIESLVRVRSEGAWTDWYSLGEWSSDSDGGHRRSIKDQNDERVNILTDTLQARRGADAYQLRVDLYGASVERGPEVKLVAAVTTTGATRTALPPSKPLGSAVLLDVPERSQMVYPGGGEVWCSPTSTSMVMAYWAEVLDQSELNRPVPEVAAGTYDPVYRGNGNWPFNTAYAGDAGLTAYVSRASSLRELETWLASGVPVIASLGWAAGQLPNAPIASTNGHLLVIVGFTDSGDVVANDPAGDPRRGQRVRRVYNRASFESLWLSHSGGTIYLIYPAEHPIPL